MRRTSCRRNRRLPGPRPGHFPLGSLHSRAAARLVGLTLEVQAEDQRNAWLSNVTPRERALMEALGGIVNPTALMMVRAMLERARIFGMELPELRPPKESAAVRAPDAT